MGTERPTASARLAYAGPMDLAENKAFVVAVDLTKGSKRVMEHALRLASREPEVVQFHLIHVTEPNIANVKPTADLNAPELTGHDPKKVQDFVEHRLSDFRAAAPNARCPEVAVHTDFGDPAEKIVALARHVDADLIIVGTHGRTGIKRMILGSVAERIVRLAGCPVLVIREKAHAAEG